MTLPRSSLCCFPSQPVSPSEFQADYVLMQNTFPPSDSLTTVRFRWAAEVLDNRSARGFVNAYFQPPLPVTFFRLGAGEFPTFPVEASGLVNAPTGVVRDPNTCVTPGCPLVFKFTIKRVTSL